MSRVRRLSIIGIRNFGDEKEEEIRFTRPLTLIIGDNGVGKTTIIEALRYASTGEFPPGSDRGKGFIHDPTLKKSQTTVRGEVKTEFVDKSGIVTKVTRAMEATRTESQIKFKTVDNSISKVNKKTGEEYSISHRCADVDREMKESLGLSPAILNYVIFCHQDDANWPTTDDGKKLKERFDEIFDTSKYNKALEQIRKLIKEKNQTVRMLTIELNALSVIVDEVRAKELKLKEYQDRRLKSAYDIQETAKKLEPVKKQINEINNLEKKHMELTSEKKQKEVEVYLAEQELRTLESSIKEFFNGSDKELAAALKSYDDDLEKKMEKIDEIQSSISDLSDKESKISKSLKEQHQRIGSFELQIEEQKRKIAERNNLLNEILTEWNMDPIDSQTSEGFIRSTIEEVDVNYQSLEESLNDTQKKYDKEENEAEKKVESLRNHRMKIDVELKRCEKEISDVKNSIRDTKDKILKADDIEKKSNAVDKKLEESNKLIQHLSDEIVAKSYSKLIDQTMKSLENVEEKVNKTDELMILLQNQHTTKSKIENLESELERKNQNIENFRKKYGQQLEDLLGKNEVPKKELKNTVNKFQQTLNERLNKLRQEVVQEQKKATTLETTIEHLRKEFRAKLAETQCDKHKIATHCSDYKNYDGTMLTLSAKLRKLQNQRGMFAFQGTAYSEYVKKLSEPDPCCPLCDRDFPKSSDALKVADKLKEEIKNHPERLKSCEEELNKIKANHEALLALKTTVEKIFKFEEVEKDEMRKKIDENRTKLEASKKSIEDMHVMISGLEKKIEMCNNLSGYLAVWDQCLNDIEQLESNYNEILLDMDDSNFRDDRTIEEVQNEREELKQKKKEIQDEIASLRKKLDLQNEEIKKAKDLRSKVLEEQLSIHNEVQNLKQWRESLTQLLKKEAELINTIRNLQQQLTTAQNKLDNGLRELENLKSKHREQQDKERKKLSEYSKRIDKLNSLHLEVVSLQAKKIEIRLEETKKEMTENEKILEDIKLKATQFKQRLSEYKEDISSYELRKRNLSDNSKYRQFKSKVVEIKELIKQLTDQIQELDIENSKKNLEFLKRKAEKLEKEINIAMGSEKELQHNISQLEDELQKEEYCTSRNKYRSKWLEKAVTENVISDLQIYVKALDLAVTNHHEERMNSVNKSMKNLWNLIYTGTDTTSIQIRTDATVEGKARRQFNYKLVQIKHGVEMDMKGRCSAGQRVLASIVIRLALAETFYDQCGMLALDEPTTNLDSHNAAKLADTLYQYVSLRAADQKNFQLIIITHDANFIHKLSQLNKNGGFYELYRNNEGLTSIQYLSIDAENQRRRRLDDDVSDEESQVNNAIKAPNKPSSIPNSNSSKKRTISPSTSQSSSKKPYTFKL